MRENNAPADGRRAHTIARPDADLQTRDRDPHAGRGERGCAVSSTARILDVIPDNIPAELTERPQWVVWLPEERADGRINKVPHNPRTGYPASHSNPRHWGTFAEAVAAYQCDTRWAGIGYVFHADDPYAGVDLDGCRYPDTGGLEPWAEDIVRRLATYTEASPSGTGVKAIVRGRLEGSGRKSKRVEVYDRERFFTLTGHRLPDAPATIEDRHELLTALVTELFPPRQTTTNGRTHEGYRAARVPTAVLLERAGKAKNGSRFMRLWQGDTSEYEHDDSRADAALCRLLAFWTGPDREWIDALFRESGLYRDKWERADYRDRTIGLALEGLSDWYDWNPPTFVLNGEHEHAAPSDGVEASALPQINAGDQHLPRVAAAAWAALHARNDPPTLFRYGGLPVRIEEDEHGAPSPKTLTEDRLRYELARAANWYRKNRDGETLPALPPVHVVKDMLATPDLPLPVLIGIIEAPAFGPDGSLHDTPGYHPASRTYYHPRPGFRVPPVPNEPTAADITRARDLILTELLGDFPFIGDAERAHAVALLLLPFVRGLIDGPTPLHLIEKPTPGTGASLLADVLTYPAIGRPPAATTEGRDEDEWRKRLTAKLRAGAPIVLIDNLRRRLDSANVAAAITSSVWEDRVLGTSDTVRLPVRCVWIATGNNPALSSEITRRTIRIRLDARSDRPWLRKDFRHPNLRQWAATHRADLVWAALTLARAWLAAGRPAAADMPVLGMFEAWSRVMGGILTTAGITGFLSNLEEFYDASDTEGAAIRAFLGAWWDKHQETPVPSAHLFPIATAPDSALPLTASSDQGQRVQLGNLLRELDGRIYPLEDGLTVRVERAGEHKRAVLWRLAPQGGESHDRDSPERKPHVDAENGHTRGGQGESGEFFSKRAHAKATQHNDADRVKGTAGNDSLDSPVAGDQSVFSASDQRNRLGESHDRDSPDADDWGDVE